uniref:photosystem I P700 apoprotein A1 n=1 Tax=Cephaleuros virescens TaxID=173371 RepID=UPI001EDE4355|nr:photosystem I P700 apoprotein A1 [Cephaleuros virescens]UIB38669.1 photosystem I P700 apoprotein A1 [Cephaleuros virescens]
MVLRPPEYEVKNVRVLVDKNPVEARFDLWAKPGHFSRALSKGPTTTAFIWNLHADAHDFELQTNECGWLGYVSITYGSGTSRCTNVWRLSFINQEIARKVFSAHFGQLGVIFIWLSGMWFHGARFSNYEAWLTDPIHIKPSAQVVWPIVGQEMINGDVGGGFQGIQITSGFFQLWRASGITSELQLYSTAIGALVMAGLFFVAGYFHYHRSAPKLEWFLNPESILNHHLAGLLGLGSLAWAGHQIHVALPINTLLDAGTDPKEIPLPHEFLNRDVIGQLFPSFQLGLMPLFRGDWAAYSDILTFNGGLNPVNGSLWMTDVIHHHVAIAVLFIFAGHLYRTNFGVGLIMKQALDNHVGPVTGQGHQGIYRILLNSLHAQLAVNLALLGSLSIVVAHHQYSMPPYPYISIDYATQLSLFTHHNWIGGFLIVGAGAHAAIFMVRDYKPDQENRNNLLDRILRHRDAIISHLNWVCLFLGFHSFGLYIHNDTMSALGRPQDMFSDKAIQLQPVFAQFIQNIHSLAFLKTAPNANTFTSFTWGSGISEIGGRVGMMPIPLGTSDFLVHSTAKTTFCSFCLHHIHAFTIHVTVLILLKGVLFARSSRLIPDKYSLGFRFPCDGPGRGGTCQVSALKKRALDKIKIIGDHVFLGAFWMYNSISVAIFHFSWKCQSDCWGTVNPDGTVSHITGGNFADSANNINGWLRDFLWSQSSQVIQSYGSALSPYGLAFLGAHFVWAFSLMFLFSGRGYWQELIESILWAHNKLKFAPAIAPRALSITQGRAVGLAHYLLGGIVTTWSFFTA